MTEIDRLKRELQVAEDALNFILNKRKQMNKAVDKADVRVMGLRRRIATAEGTRKDYGI